MLTMNLKARVEPAGCAPAMRDRVLFSVDAIGASTMTWATANPNGRPTINGDFLEAVVTFTGLPERNTDFGAKVARLMLDGAVHETKNYEVFFARDATNHPGGQAGSPNWYHYWGQVVNVGTTSYAGSSGSPTMARVLGMVDWSYETAPDKTTLYIYDEVVTDARAYGVGNQVSGIDNFVSTLYHESRHVDQISRADTLVPNVRCWQYGYSWNKPHNHWAPGPDGLWGPPPGTATASVATAPPFEPGGGDDASIDHPSWVHWPNVWPLPNPIRIFHPIEEDAVLYADARVSEGDFADHDWGDPGKNHMTLLKYND
ncbi:hypothetical protein [Sorangium cellulosum]|uniref:hypothetical protein n=1 Tax=Sorangium cellulosum TaxID=56 RepID=UPI0011DC7EA8|nr:hypothetical protein [Sorangium cellulosum]